jgi:hypothetical protein
LNAPLAPTINTPSEANALLTREVFALILPIRLGLRERDLLRDILDAVWGEIIVKAAPHDRLSGKIAL